MLTLASTLLTLASNVPVGLARLESADPHAPEGGWGHGPAVHRAECNVCVGLARLDQDQSQELAKQTQDLANQSRDLANYSQDLASSVFVPSTSFFFFVFFFPFMSLWRLRTFL